MNNIYYQPPSSNQLKSNSSLNSAPNIKLNISTVPFGLQRFYVHNFSAQAYFDTLNTEEYWENQITFWYLCGVYWNDHSPQCWWMWCIFTSTLVNNLLNIVAGSSEFLTISYKWNITTNASTSICSDGKNWFFPPSTNSFLLKHLSCLTQLHCTC